MSGVFGFIDTRRNSVAGETLARMAQSLAHCPWHVIDQHVTGDGVIGAGRAAIGIFNRAAQPLVDASGSVRLFFCGELYSGDTIVSNPEQIALEAYLANGPAYAHELNGQFTALVIDEARARLVLTNDRFGLYHHYFATIPGGIVFAPELKAVLTHPAVSKTLDQVALAQYMRFQHVLGERTFFEHIQLLPTATVLSVNLRNGAKTQESYWSFSDLPQRPEHGAGALSLNDAADEAARLLGRAVRRLSSDALRPGVYLSGGLDSRALLGLSERRPITSITYGDPACRDVRFAERIARVCGSSHHWFDLRDSQWVTETADLHLRLTEGFHSWIHAHGMSTLPAARELIDVNLSGWDGSTVMSHPDSWAGLQWPRADDTAALVEDFQYFNQTWTWPGITEAEEQLLYAPAKRHEMRGLAFDSFRAQHRLGESYPPAVRRELFYVRQHCRRLTQYFIVFNRSHIECRLPFFDYDVFDFMFSLPMTLRGRGQVWHALIARALPKLARIPNAADNRLPMPNGWRRRLHAAAVATRARVNRHIAPIFNDDLKLYADYEAWLRAHLRPWAESILFDPRTLERGIFDPAFVRSMMTRHASGFEPWTIGKIAPIMAYEMMLRHLHDG